MITVTACGTSLGTLSRPRGMLCFLLFFVLRTLLPTLVFTSNYKLFFNPACLSTPDGLASADMEARSSFSAPCPERNSQNGKIQVQTPIPFHSMVQCLREYRQKKNNQSLAPKGVQHSQHRAAVQKVSHFWCGCTWTIRSPHHSSDIQLSAGRSQLSH